MSTVSAIVIFIASMCFPLIAVYIVFKNSERLASPEFQAGFGTLVEGLKI